MEDGSPPEAAGGTGSAQGDNPPPYPMIAFPGYSSFRDGLVYPMGSPGPPAPAPHARHQRAPPLYQLERAALAAHPAAAPHSQPETSQWSHPSGMQNPNWTRHGHVSTTFPAQVPRPTPPDSQGRQTYGPHHHSYSTHPPPYSTFPQPTEVPISHDPSLSAGAYGWAPTYASGSSLSLDPPPFGPYSLGNRTGQYPEYNDFIRDNSQVHMSSSEDETSNYQAYPQNPSSLPQTSSFGTPWASSSSGQTTGTPFQSTTGGISHQIPSFPVEATSEQVFHSQAPNINSQAWPQWPPTSVARHDGQSYSSAETGSRTSSTLQYQPSTEQAVNGEYQPATGSTQGTNIAFGPATHSGSYAPRTTAGPRLQRPPAQLRPASLYAGTIRETDEEDEDKDANGENSQRLNPYLLPRNQFLSYVGNAHALQTSGSETAVATPQRIGQARRSVDGHTSSASEPGRPHKRFCVWDSAAFTGISGSTVGSTDTNYNDSGSEWRDIADSLARRREQFSQQLEDNQETIVPRETEAARNAQGEDDNGGLATLLWEHSLEQTEQGDDTGSLADDEYSEDDDDDGATNSSDIMDAVGDDYTETHLCPDCLDKLEAMEVEM